MNVIVDYDEVARRWAVELEGAPCGDFVDTDDDGRAFYGTPSCLLHLEEDGMPMSAEEDGWIEEPNEPSIYIEGLGKSGATCVRISDLKAAIEQFESHVYKPTTTP